MILIFIISGIFLFSLVQLLLKESSREFYSIAIFPNRFMILGISILILCSIAPVIFNNFDTPVISEIRNLFILVGLLTLCLSKEKNESGSLNEFRFITFISSFIIVSLVYQIFLIFNLFEIRNLSASQLPICSLASYLFIFHLNKRKFIKV